MDDGMDFFDNNNISRDRNDEDCSSCAGGILKGTNFYRWLDKTHIQTVWICEKCGSFVVMIDEVVYDSNTE